MFKETLSTATVVALTVSLAGCTGPREGESFIAKGIVQEVDENSIELSDIEIIEGDQPLLEDGSETMYDTYRDMACFEYETTDDLNVLLETGKIAVGDTVTIQGSVGTSYENCIVPGFNKGAYPNISVALMDSIKVVE